MLLSDVYANITEREDTNWIRVTVSDTGIGIPQSELPYLFAKFSRGRDKSRLKVQEGWEGSV